jgi:hypothetical protein
MGAGCYCTNYLKQKAAWIDFPNSDEEEFSREGMEDDIANVIKSIGYYHNDDLNFENGLFKLNFESTYYGDGLVIQLTPRYEEYSGYYGVKNPLYFLAMANFNKAESKIWKTLQKAGYKLRIATSGYTSTELSEIK